MNVLWLISNNEVWGSYWNNFRVHNRNVATEVEVISTFGPQGKDISLNYNMTPEIRNFLIQIYTEFWCNLRIPDYDMIIQKK